MLGLSTTLILEMSLSMFSRLLLIFSSISASSLSPSLVSSRGPLKK